MAINSYSSFWGGSDQYATLAGTRSHAARKVFAALRHRSVLKVRAQIVALIAASTTTTGAVSHVRTQYVDGNAGIIGGAKTIETVTETSDQANTAATTLKSAATMSTRPAYVADASGNGGPALS